MKNWKTTTTGITMIAGGIAGFYFSAKSNALNEAAVTSYISAILGGIGLLFAKDFNVTGGTTSNVPNDASVVKTTTQKDA